MSDEVCFFPVTDLKIPERIEVQEAAIFPLPADPEDPVWGNEFQREWLSRWFGEEDRARSSIIQVPYEASLGDDADEAARRTAKRVLSRLRVALDGEQDTHEFQLRFRLSRIRWTSEGKAGWSIDPGVSILLELSADDPAFERISEHALYALPLHPNTDVDRRAELAMEWLDRAHFADDMMVQTLFRFFALEALLGDKSEGLKAHGLAVRRAALASSTAGVFRHPARVFDLYDEVRSAAVHGEPPPELDKSEANKFAWDVREALVQFVEYAEGNGFTKRKEVRAALDASETRAKIVAGLVDQDPNKWRPFAPSPMSYDEVLTALLGMMGKEIVVSYSSGNAKAFSFFSAILETGLDAADAEILERHNESIELQFGNGASITIDPDQFQHAERTGNDNGDILKVSLGGAVLSFIAADLSAE